MKPEGRHGLFMGRRRSMHSYSRLQGLGSEFVAVKQKSGNAKCVYSEALIAGV